MEIEIIPAILAYSAKDLALGLKRTEGAVDRVQVDIIGKAFSSEVTVAVEELKNSNTSLALDLHLMVKEPVTLLGNCEMVGADRVFGHIEYMRDKHEFVEHALALGIKVGLALDLNTDIAEIEEIITNLDSVLLMAVPAGKSGQKFDVKVIKKIEIIRNLDKRIAICIDGGINLETIGACAAAGANEFAVGTFLWESEDIEDSIIKLKEAVK